MGCGDAEYGWAISWMGAGDVAKKKFPDMYIALMDIRNF